MTRRGAKRWHRVPSPTIMAVQYPATRCWQRDVHDGHLSVFVGRELDDDDTLVWHLSISHRTNENPPQPGRYPTWDEISDARYRFVPDAVNVALLLPPRAEYINVHGTTFHLWEVRR